MKKEKGNITVNLLLFVVFCGVGFYNFVFIPQKNTKILNDIRYNPPTIDIENKEMIDGFKSKSKPEIKPLGKYYTKGEADGKSYSITYYFGKENTLTKELLIKIPFVGTYKLSGSAKYDLNGSVLVFDKIVGDKILFSEIGEAISIPNKKSIVSYDADKKTILYKR